METLANFEIAITMLLSIFCLLLIMVAIFCSVVRRIDRKRKVNPKLMKWVDILDWFEEDGNDE